jgi:hypothetical protein
MTAFNSSTKHGKAYLRSNTVPRKVKRRSHHLSILCLESQKEGKRELISRSEEIARLTVR